MTPSSLSGADTLSRREAQPEAPDRRTRFESLYARDSKELWALAYAACQDSDAAMRCVQQAFTEAWDQMDNGQDQGEWLRARVRTLSTQPQRGRPPATTESAESAVIRRMLGEAPVADREILALHYAMDYESARIAALLGREPAQVESVLATQKKRLAAALKNGVTDVAAA